MLTPIKLEQFAAWMLYRSGCGMRRMTSDDWREAEQYQLETHVDGGDVLLKAVKRGTLPIDQFPILTREGS